MKYWHIHVVEKNADYYQSVNKVNFVFIIWMYHSHLSLFEIIHIV